MQRGGHVYMMASSTKKVLYIGVTSNLYKRVYEHRAKHYPASFTARYSCRLLVYYVFFDRIEEAILEEKRLKGGSRKQKEELIAAINPDWKDLWGTFDS